MSAWLRANDIPDKDAVVEDSLEAAAERRRRLRAKRPDATLDLHGMTRDEAWIALETFFEDSQRWGLEKLLLVHGKGNHSEGEAVLKQAVQQFIENCPAAGESGQGNAALGGQGATWVILKT
ncbi:MAG: Smr/MutS family protein [Treponema sp.]|nr:Smr/MutS family protein [Treponema sp.]